MPDPLDIIWQAAEVPDPVLAADGLLGVAPSVMQSLAALGFLREAGPAAHVTCDACADQHVERVAMVKYLNGQTRFFIPCPENLRIEVPRERLRQWAVDYMPLMGVLAKALSAQGSVAEVVPRRVWSLGRASLAGKSKPIWAARGLAWPDAAQVAASLPKGRSPILFFLGQAADAGLLEIPPESIIDLRSVMSMNGELLVDRQAVEDQLGGVPEAPTKKPTRKQAKRDAIVGALKRELHERILSMKSALRAADDAEKPYELPDTKQKELAAAIKATAPAVSRAISTSKDKELAIMLQTITNPDLIRSYSRR